MSHIPVITDCTMAESVSDRADIPIQWLYAQFQKV